MTIRDLICWVLGHREAVRGPFGKHCPRCGEPEHGKLDNIDYETFRKRYWRA